VQAADYGLLLQGYIERDAAGKHLAMEKERAALELQRYALETGTAFTVSSGDTVFTFSPSGLSVSAKPGVALGFPNLRNTRVTLDAPLGFDGENLSQYGVDLSVSAGIITGQGDTRKAGLEESRRSFSTALRNLADHRRLAEQEFCKTIKNLLSLEDAVLKARDAVLDAERDLAEKRAGGYGASSVVWRTADLTLRSRERELNEAERKLDMALGEFAESCGAAPAGIPEIPTEPLLSIGSFDPRNYSELEEARWNHELNNLKRRALNHPFTLDGTAGFSWRENGSTNSTAASAGLGFTRGGLSLSAGVSLPLEQMDEPSLTLRLQWKPSGSRISKLEAQLRELAAQGELRVIQEAEKQFSGRVIDYERRREDLLWQQENYEEEADLYRINAEEQKLWFDRGIIRESDYQDAQTNYLMAINRLRSARIDRRLYNLELAGLFRTSGEFDED
jgi:outer membrane protein TolC